MPLLLLVSLIVWGTLSAGGSGGRPGVNQVLGEAPISTSRFNDFELVDLDGQTLKLSDLKGKIVMIDFWSSWCAPCRAEAETLVDAYQVWSDRGVEFVGISVWDSQDEVVRFAKRYGIEYPLAIDNDGSVAVDFGVRGIPEKFFVDSEGEIVRKITGPNTRRSLNDVLTEMSEQALGATAN